MFFSQTSSEIITEIQYNEYYNKFKVDQEIDFVKQMQVLIF